MRKIPKGFIFFLILFLSADFFIRSVEANFWSLLTGIVDYKSRVLSDKNQPYYNAIIMGDSQMLKLDAKHLSDQLTQSLGKNFRIFNFAIPNHGVRTYALLLEKYLKHHKKPEYVLFQVTPVATTGEWSLKNTGERSLSLYMMADLYSIKEVWGVLPIKDLVALVAVKAERLSALILYRAKIKKAIAKNDWNNSIRVHRMLKLMKLHNGGVLQPRASPVNLEEVRAAKYYDWPIYPEVKTTYWYERVCQVSLKYGVKVLIVNVPVIDEIVENRDIDGSNQRYKKFILDLKSKYPNVDYIIPLVRSYSYSNFEDWPHLNKQGAKKYVLELADDLAQYFKAEVNIN